MIIGTTFRGLGFRESNAVRSWKLAFPEAEIVLFGDETKAAARELDTDWYGNVQRFEGVPLLSDIVSHLSFRAKPGHDRIMYVNADIMIAPMGGEVLARIYEDGDPFLASGLRTGTWIDEEIVLPRPDWWWEDWASLGKLADPCGADWFLFRPGMFEDMPPFCVGRTTFDNYLIYSANEAGIRTANVTSLVIALHQKHEQDPDSYSGPLAERNQSLMHEMYPEWTPRAGWVDEMENIGGLPMAPRVARATRHLANMTEVMEAVKPELLFEELPCELP